MLRITHIKELATGRSHTPGVRVLRDAAIVIEDQKIIAVGHTENILRRYPKRRTDTEIHAKGMIALPGFIDCHTHLIFAGSRADEYRDKLKGASYSALHKKGRGIHSTVRATRNASEEELFRSAQRILREMLRKGTTTVEIKSGYGLTLKDELKILRVIDRLRQTEAQDIISTFLGAHTVPLEYKDRRDAYVELVIEKMLPRIAEKKLADYVDVFCDPLGFTAEETKKIFARATECGIKIRIHGEQTAHGGGAAVGAAYHAASIDHCDHLREKDIALMKRSGSVAVLLPGVLLHTLEWKKNDLPMVTKRLRTEKIPIALATDFNPGSSPLVSMKLAIDLGIRFFRMTPEECLIGATQNPAIALGKGDLVGTIEPGKQADLLLLDAPSIADYLHRIGDWTIGTVLKRGVVVNKISV